MYLVAVSGGPDSMFLLNQYKNKNIIVAHVNYQQREDSAGDEKIVVAFCKKNNIPFYVLNVDDRPTGNFQNWARLVRYNFFKKIYQKNNCKKLIVAHHKDDFLETAIMQQRTGRTPRFFGIKKRSLINGMNVYRPYVDLYWKAFLIKKNIKNKINYATDSSNEKLIYSRNKIRAHLATRTTLEKERMRLWFVITNWTLKKKFRRVDKKVRKIISSGHKLKYYRQLKRNAKEVMFEIIHKELGQVKLSTNKVESFGGFVNGNEGKKKFIINKSCYVYKKSGKLLFICN